MSRKGAAGRMDGAARTVGPPLRLKLPRRIHRSHLHHGAYSTPYKSIAQQPFCRHGSRLPTSFCSQPPRRLCDIAGTRYVIAQAVLLAR